MYVRVKSKLPVVVVATMNAQQQRALDAALAGRNVFVTGSGGAGKTFWVHALCDHLLRVRCAGDVEAYKESVILVAPTGIAATAIGGSTIHSALGVGVPRTSRDFERALHPKNRRRIRRWRTLIIDEVSMLSGEFLAQLDRVLRLVHGGGKQAQAPFGGVQLICVGDFYQLPPIRDDRKTLSDADAFRNSGYAFEADAWRSADFENVVLTQPFRHRGDRRFSGLLNKVRSGSPELAAMALADIVAECRSGPRYADESSERDPLHREDGIRPTRIYALNADVDRINETELAKLEAPIFEFAASDVVEGAQIRLGETSASYKKRTDAYYRHEFFKGPKTLKLAVGAQVLLSKTTCFESGMINGTRGVVTAVDRRSNAVHVRFAHGVVPIGATDFKHQVVDDEGRVVTLRRRAVPLKLAWALTVHKSQGMSLDRVVLSLQSMFAAGHAYVALSRVRTLDGLSILDVPRRAFDSVDNLLAWTRTIVRIDPAVRGFYESLADPRT